MEKQTAVEWLIEKLNQCEPMYSGIQSNEHKEYLEKLVQQAKEMEKEQIMKAYISALPYGLEYSHYDKYANKYYNETYNKDK
jgi:O-methyltransferase involved in polyketide biosynthesis